MRSTLVSLSLLLAACGSKDEIADKVEERAEQRAEAMEKAGREMEGALQKNLLEQQADTQRQAGQERAEAIRESDLDADQLTEQQEKALIEADNGTVEKVRR